MGMHWKDVKAEIEKEIDKIWFKEPLELTLSKKGIFPSGAGAEGQAVGNFIFIWGDTHALGSCCFEGPMNYYLDSDDFSLDICKKIFWKMNENKCKILGLNLGEGTNCPAAWLNLPKFYRFMTDILSSYDTIQTKKEFKSLLWSWFNYVDRINRWSYTLFPWEVIGQMLPKRELKDLTPEEIEQCREAGLFDMVKAK